MQNPLQPKRSKTDLQNAALFGNSSELARFTESLQYKQRLSLYDSPPPVEISIEEFETFAIDRLQVLKSLESVSLRNRSEDELKQVMSDSLSKFLSLNPNESGLKGVDVDFERRKDHISHYILRLAYCKSEDLRAWFILHEVLLFKLKWNSYSKNERRQFLHSLHLDFDTCSDNEKSALSHLLADATVSMRGGNIKTETFYKVPFERVPDLIGHRSVYLHGGTAYVPQVNLLSVVLAIYKERLSASLDMLARSLARIDDDDRLKPILANMSRQYIGKDYNDGSGSISDKITHEDVDKLVSHFPPCMSHLQSQLKRNAHLKHFARMQFGLFLKGIGLSLEEALIYWRRSFSKLSEEQFQKGGYAYNIRHNYGQEGKRANYTPPSCIKIITANQPGNGDSHGCPFKHFSQENLNHMLSRHGLNSRNCTEVMELAKGGHYQVACTKYFEITRGKFNPHVPAEGENAIKTNQHNLMDTISHPNAFFEQSMKQAGLDIRSSESQKEVLQMELE